MGHVGDESVESVETYDRCDCEHISESQACDWLAIGCRKVIVVAFASLRVQHGRYC
jgi:hypothetical protein